MFITLGDLSSDRGAVTPDVVPRGSSDGLGAITVASHAKEVDTLDGLGRAWDINTDKAKAFLSADDDGTYVRDITNGLTAKQAWQQSVWLHQCIHTTSVLGARQKIGLRRNEKTEVKNHPLLNLMYRPNPVMTRFHVFYLTIAWLQLMGDCAWYLDNGTLTEGKPGGKIPKYIWPVAPWHIEPVPDYTSIMPTLLAWRITLANGYTFNADPLDVIFFRYPNPFDLWRGEAPMVSARLATASDIASIRHNLKFISNGARPLGVLETQESVNEVQAKQMLNRFDARHRGEPGRPALLDMGTKYHETQLTQAEMEFMDGRRMSREEIAGAFKVPPIELGIMDHASFANAREQTAVMWRGNVITNLDLICDAINEHGLREDFSERGVASYFDLKNVQALKEDQKVQAEIAKHWREQGVPFSQINEKLELGFDPFPGWDVPMMPFGWVLVSDITEPEPDEPVEEDPVVDPAATKKPAVDDDDDDDEPVDAAEAKSIRDIVAGAVRLMPTRAGATKWGRYNAFVKATAHYSHRVFEATVTKRCNDTIAMLRKGGAINAADLLQKMLLIIEQDKEPLKKFSRMFFTKAAGAGIEEVKALLSKMGAEITGDFSISSPKAVEFLLNKTIRVTKILDYQKELIRETVASVFEVEGGGEMIIPALKAELQDTFNFSAKRARMVSRNEIADAVSGGRFLTLDAEGVEEHEWVSEIDERTREEHVAANEKTVRVGEIFEDTQCRYPHDPDGPADQTIQCRCVTLPVIQGNRAFPPGSGARVAYWEVWVRGWAPIKNAYAKRLKRMYNEQREQCLELVAAEAA